MDENISMPLIGDMLPDMTVTTTHGVLKLPEHYKGKYFVLFSHPADYTPVCTTEFYSFAKLYPEFKKLNCELIGLSIDQVYSHMKWGEWIKENLDMEISFPIIADHGDVAKKLGMVHPNKGASTVRAVFIMDTEGKIRIILYYPQEIGRNMSEILRIVKILQIADKENVAIPANWPNSELVGDHVIVPPARDVETAKKRLEAAKKGEFECYDWWLCHKKIKHD
ncbi:MAG: peroxiredoxin [Candidatus Lokiarchaeota archaeon]|nr:peroxiredoxin [Candidatus Lokiarchaeota archaeon]